MQKFESSASGGGSGKVSYLSAKEKLDIFKMHWDKDNVDKELYLLTHPQTIHNRTYTIMENAVMQFLLGYYKVDNFVDLLYLILNNQGVIPVKQEWNEGHIKLLLCEIIGEAFNLPFYDEPNRVRNACGRKISIREINKLRQESESIYNNLFDE